MKTNHFPEKQGLYDPQFEHDNCGVGFVCNYKGIKSYSIVEQGVQVLENLVHRGATGADPNTGDGAGVLIQMPHEFLKGQCKELGIQLPGPGGYSVGMLFLPPNKKDREYCETVLENTAARHRLKILGWREVPVEDSILGRTALETKPVIKQVFLSVPEGESGRSFYEQTLYIVRKKVENIIRASTVKQKSFFYIVSLSSKILCYKGLLISTQLRKFFPDLNHSDIASSFALVHARYSTNTFPTWDLAQPFRYLAHNGEINTLRGNVNWMQARQGLLQSELFGKELKNLYPVITPGGSDSAAIDNVVEMLVLGGRSIPHVMMMLIPEAWQNDKYMNEPKKDFYKYHACLTEPWDGPAAIAFTDGRYIGATLDRNGLRPSRLIITKDNLVVMASEAGVLNLPEEKILSKNRLQPGKMFLIDTEEGRIVDDAEIKDKLAKKNPYKKWLKEKMEDLGKLPGMPIGKGGYEIGDIIPLQKAFGYSREDLRMLIKPMAVTGSEPTGSMGDDTPLAVLSKRPRLLYDYFKQMFAQVTNPAIDPIREELVMSLESYIGKEKNLLDETPEHCHKLKVKQPILTNEDLEKIRNIAVNSFKTKTISTLFEVNGGINSFKSALDKICAEVSKSVKDGYSFIILSDKGVDERHSALPALLSVSSVHHHLTHEATRTQVGLILESGEPREIMHFALLFGYGADCVNPYLVYETIKGMVKDKELETDYKTAQEKYINAACKGILKVLSKMGISTLQSYRGAQIFEALGLNKEVIEKYFTGTVSRIGGIGLDTICADTLKRHENGYKEDVYKTILQSGGLYQWRRDGEFHLWNPETIPLLQQAVQNGDTNKYKEFAELINNQCANPTTLRSLLKFKNTKPISISEVEPADSIVKRFVTGAMSFGSISKEAHETIATAMNRMGARSNSGEGGEDPLRFSALPNGDSLCSATKQVASGRFGVTINYLVNATELQIKVAQGAKPGEGGQLPGHKVSVDIARTRYSTPGVTLISPPPHHDIYSIEDLAQLIFDLKNANPRARINVKLVSEAGVGTVAAGVAKGYADAILISGGDGGTGASPLSSIKHAGLPWELGLSETHQTLVLNNLRGRVRIQTDGQMRTGRDVVIAALLGAEEYGFASAILVVLGCTMLRHCNLNNCVFGIATQEECLRKRFNGRPEYIRNYFHFVAEEVRLFMAQLGIRKMDELIGRTDFLGPNTDIMQGKIKGIDFSKILYKPSVRNNVETHCIKAGNNGVSGVLDNKLIEICKPALTEKLPVTAELIIKNTDRSTGTMLSGYLTAANDPGMPGHTGSLQSSTELRASSAVLDPASVGSSVDPTRWLSSQGRLESIEDRTLTKCFGEKGLSDDTINLKFKGTAGQSFGAFLARGVTLELEGDANDYVGKGLSGGKIIIYPSRKSIFKPEENVIIGNTTFYGATGGEAYIRGIAGERFCIRNSGLHGVVEGVGDHGCEYMTGGVVVILGRTGRNFAAGMSGGIAYVYNLNKDFSQHCNLDMVGLEEITEGDGFAIYRLLEKHYRYTHSTVAKNIMDNFKSEIDKFVKVMPIEYKKVLEGQRQVRNAELAEVSDG